MPCMKQVPDILAVIWVTSKHVHFSCKTRTLAYRECKETDTAVSGGQRCHLVPASIKGGSGVCVVKRCSLSLRISSLILFSWDFLHTSVVWGFCECERAFFFGVCSFFSGRFGAHGKLMDV